MNLLCIMYLILDKFSREYRMHTMNLTTRGKYAVAASLDLAMNSNKSSFVAVSEIAERQSIPAAYLEQLFRYLRKADILESLRGPGGGYKLTRPTSEIKIGQIIAAVEKRMDATQCGGEENCSSGSTCLAHNLWMELNAEVDDFLMGKSLEDVVRKKANRNEEITDEKLIAIG